MSGAPTAPTTLLRRAPEGSAALPWPVIALEAAIGNTLGSGVYRRWVGRIGLVGDERVLEVGTGAGACARHLASALPAGRLTCLEVDSRWLAIARHRLAAFGERVEFVEADAASWSRTEAFDVVVAHFVLHDIASPDRQAVLRRIAESLRPGGRLHLREPVGHGMGVDELAGQLRSAGFRPGLHAGSGRVPLMGETIDEVWTVAPRQAAWGVPEVSVSHSAAEGAAR